MAHVMTTTIQLTSKKYKAHLALSSLMSFISACFFIYLITDIHSDSWAIMFSFLGFILGVLWYWATKILIWWNHA